MQTLSPETMHQLQQAITRWQLVDDALPFQTATSVLQYVRAPQPLMPFLPGQPKPFGSKVAL